jgi:hypothetical protein
MAPVRVYVTIPSDDKEFRATVEKLGAQASDFDRLRELVVEVYPDARVSVGELLGALPGEPTRVYVYRDRNVHQADS